MMNNNIAEELSKQVRDFFGSSVQPLGLFKSCNRAISLLKSYQLEVTQLNRDIACKNKNKGINDLTISTISTLKCEISKLKKDKRALNNKLIVANHKCSAYESILKDAIK